MLCEQGNGPCWQTPFTRQIILLGGLWRSQVPCDTSRGFRSSHRGSTTWGCSSSLSAQPLFLQAEWFKTQDLAAFISIHVWFLTDVMNVKVQHMYEVWPWGYWEWTESLPEVQLCCDPRGSVSRGKVICEGCRALRDDKHHAYQIEWWRITSDRGTLIQQPGEGLTGRCVLHPDEAYRLILAASWQLWCISSLKLKFQVQAWMYLFGI